MPKTIDYAYKAEVLRSGLPRVVKSINRAYYAQTAFELYGEVVNCDMNFATAEKMRSFLLATREDDYKESEKINNAEFARTRRLKKRITDILLRGDSLFLTLTFNDKSLNRTNSKTRRRYVSRYLKACGGRYVANIDFGKKNGREHYHAVISADNIDFKPWHEHGAIKAEKVHAVEPDGLKYSADVVRLSKYVAKLTNHAIKETTKRSVLIYSR